MTIAVGTVLVLFTWAVIVIGLVAMGLPVAVAARGRRAERTADAQRIAGAALWWGLLIATITAYLLNLVLPLQSAWVALVLLVMAVSFGGIGVSMLGRPLILGLQPNLRLRSLVVGLALAAAVVYLAAAALGPVTNYDSGLYHLGAIGYASEYPTIPGLANLYFPFGYGNAEFPLAALLGNGPWQGEGFRLLNGLFMVLAIVDLAMRRGRRGPGAFVLAIGLVAALVPMVALSDYWMTSPTQDSAVFIMTVVATAYVTDAVFGHRSWPGDAATALVLSMLLVLFRPTMGAFAVGVCVVLTIAAARHRPKVTWRRVRRPAVLVVLVGVVAAVAATMRDVVLSGWLQYPLSLVAFDVPWRAADPELPRVATLGFHRNPADLWNSVAGWGWVGPWLTARLSQWETYAFAVLVLTTLVLAVWAGRSHPRLTPWRAVALAALPSVLATAVWWAATPPSYRFAWGPIFTMATVPIGWLLWVLTRWGGSTATSARSWQWITAFGIAVPIALVTGYSALARFDHSAIVAEREWRFGVAVPYAVAPVVIAPTRTVLTGSGLVLRQPTQSDQCWGAYPLCTPEPTAGLRMRGAGIGEGFLP